MEATGELLRLLALAAAAAAALTVFSARTRGRDLARFTLALAIGALACHVGGGWLGDGTLGLPQPGSQTSLLFLPLGVLATLPRRGARAYLAAASPALALGTAMARLGCIAAGCCMPWIAAGVEILGWLSVARMGRRWPALALPVLLTAGGALRLALDPVRALNRPHDLAAWVAAGWILCGLASLPLATSRRTLCPARSLRGTSMAVSIRHLLVFLLLVPLLGGVCDRRLGAAPLGPRAGLFEYQDLALLEVPGGHVNAAGGNLAIVRSDLSIDTWLGTVEIAAIWNSARQRWRFRWESSFDGQRLTDHTGASWDLQALEDGDAIPGGPWVRVDQRRIATRGGLIHVFDDEGLLEAVHWRHAEYPRLAIERTLVAGQRRVSQVRQQIDASDSSLVYAIERDAAGRPVAAEDRAGRRVEWTWDHAGQLAGARTAIDVEQGSPGWRYEYANASLAASINPEGERIEYVVSSRRLITASIPALDLTWSAQYHARGSDGRYATELSDPLGATRRVEFDTQRRVLARVDAVGDRIEWTWHGLRPTSLISPAGVATSFTWQAEKLSSFASPSGATTTFEWEAAGLNRVSPLRGALRRASDPLGTLEEVDYDAVGRPIARRNGAGEETRFEWDTRGALISMTDPGGVETQFGGYGVHGHAGWSRTGAISSGRVYDEVGNLLRAEGARGELGPGDPGVSERFFDANRRLAGVTLIAIDIDGIPSRHPLAIERRSDGRPLRISRPHGGDTVFVYDAAGRFVERRDRRMNAWHTTSFERDALGRVVRIERPNGTWTAHEYDAAGRRVRSASGRGSTIESETSSRYEDGRLVELEDAAYRQPERYGWDDAGRVASVTYPGGEKLVREFDARGRVTSEIFQLSGAIPLRRLDYGYDGAGREIEIRDEGELRLRRIIADGRLAELRSGDGMVRRFFYGNDGLLRETISMDADGVEVARGTLERKPRQDIDQHQAWDAVTTFAGPLAAHYEEGFLLEPWTPGGAPEAGMYATGWDDRAPAVDPTWTAWDALGHVAQVDGESFSYGPERQILLEIRDAAGATRHDYISDADGNVIERDGVALVWRADGLILAIGTQASLVWDGRGRPIERNIGGRFHRFRFGGRVTADLAGQPVAIHGPSMSIDLAGDAHRYYHPDFRGNVRFVTDARGEVLAHRRFRPHGADETQGEADGLPGFAGGLPIGDLVLIGSRVYDPQARRFLSPDPEYRLRSQHSYAFGNPVLLWDPDGRNANTALAAAAGVGLVGMVTGALLVGVATTPALLLVAAMLTVGSAGFLAGILIPISETGIESATALAAALTPLVVFAAPVGPLLGGTGFFAAGFSAGQRVQAAILGEFVVSEPICACVIEQPALDAMPDADVGGGCSGTPMAPEGLPRLRWALWVLVPLELLLCVLWLRRS